MFSRKTDSEIIRFIKDGNKKALLLLFRRNIRPVKRWIRQSGGTTQEAREHLQTALAQLWMDVSKEEFMLDKPLEELLLEKVKAIWIDKHNEIEIRNFITNKTLRSFPYRKVIAFAASILILGLLGWWWVSDIEPRFSKIWNDEADIVPTSTIDSSTVLSTNSLKPKSHFGRGKLSQATDATSDSTDVSEEDVQVVDSIGEAQDSMAASNNLDDENIVVKKDELMFSRIMQVKMLDNARKEKSLSSEAVEKLNPEAGLPEEEPIVPKSFQVEFWKSPVNYKGYRVGKAKIIFYGIEEPDWAKLYFVNDRLYLEYSSSYFILEVSDDFNNFIRANGAPVTTLLGK